MAIEAQRKYAGMRHFLIMRNGDRIEVNARDFSTIKKLADGGASHGVDSMEFVSVYSETGSIPEIPNRKEFN